MSAALPFVSIMVAARNEADNILLCLESLDKLQYPVDKLQILIGDDDSSDETAAIVRAFITDKLHFQLVQIKSQLGDTQGKANVLAQLAHQAKGQYFLFTDADTTVPTHWVQGMLAGFSTEKVGVVTGATTMKDTSFLARMQAIDWLANLLIIKILSFFNIPITAMGNNMAVSAKAYWAMGGYEKLPFSLTEDYALFRAILDKGFDFGHLFAPNITATSIAMPSVKMLLQQRNRWITGATRKEWYYKLIIWLLAVSYTVFIALFIIFPLEVGSLWLLKYLIQNVILVFVFRYLKQKRLIAGLFLFEFYVFIFNFLLLIYHFLSPLVQWKNREYK